jgi:hypothetical protein
MINEIITDDDLDDFLAAGAEVLRGLKLTPAESYPGVPMDADRQERLGAFLSFYMDNKGGRYVY